jgi:hypothetical protein
MMPPLALLPPDVLAAMTLTDDKMVKKTLKPEMQGHIDGMCSVYAVLNACKLMFDHAEQSDERLFKFLCQSISDLFPEIIYDGTEVAGIKRLLDASIAWTAKTHHREMTWSQPLKRQPMADVEEYFSYLRSQFAASPEGRTAAIIGLGKPWGHWTVIRKVERDKAFFFDSWGFPKSKSFDFFTFNKSLAGEDTEDTTYLMYHQTFFMSVQ